MRPLTKPTVRSLLILLATFDADALSDDVKLARPYLHSVSYARFAELCKSAAPANAARYDTALVAWQKANKRAVAQGERVWRSICAQEKQDRGACFDVKNMVENTGGMLEFRAANASQRIEICDRLVEQIEHEVAHGPLLGKEDFDKKYGVEEWPSGKQLAANPFAYENKVIGMVLFFEQMVTATEGIFRSRDGEIVFSDISERLFTADNANSSGYENIVLAGRVIGNKALKTPMGGEMFVPHLKFIGVQFCGAPCNCNDGWPHQCLK